LGSSFSSLILKFAGSNRQGWKEGRKGKELSGTHFVHLGDFVLVLGSLSNKQGQVTLKRKKKQRIKEKDE